MATWLKQSTAVDIGIGPFVDSTDGVTPETGLTITQPDIRLKKNGGAWAQKNAAQTLSHEENGWYEVAFDTTDTNTLGILLVAIYESGALPVWREFLILPTAVYDCLVNDTDSISADIREVLGSGVAATSVAGVLEVDITHLRGTAIAVPTVAGVLETDITHVGGTAQTAGNLVALLDAIDDFVDTEVAAIKAKTDQLVFTGSRADSSVGAVQANAIADAGVSTDLDTYQAKVDIVDDNTNSIDRYVVCWFKNSQPVLASITVPTIQVWKASDGSDLIASQAMTEIGTTETYKYDASTTERIVDGAAYVAKVEATIDGGTRTWVQVVGRDS